MIQITLEDSITSSRNNADDRHALLESDRLAYLSFRVGEHGYAVDLLQIREVRSLPQLTRVAHAPSYVLGVISLRGEIVPVIDLKKRFSLAQSQSSATPLVVVSEVEGRKVAMLVDSVNEVVSVSAQEIQSIPRTTMAIDMKYLLGMVQHESQVLLLLDLRKILTPSELHNVSEAIEERIPA